MSSFDICIHGAGFVGQTLALLLARAGLNVALLSAQSAHPEYTDIRAFALGKKSKSLLEGLSAWPAGTDTTLVTAMQIHGDANGTVSLRTPIGTEALAWIVDVPALAAILNEQVSREPRITRLAEQTHLQARLHVVCEGRHSDFREKLGVQVKATTYPQNAIAARLKCEHAHGGIARQWFNDKSEVLALLPIGGADSNQIALVWSLETAHAKQMQNASNQAFENALQASCGSDLGAMTLSSERALWPLMLSTVKPWTGQNQLGVWVLAGDAAHAVHPMAGQGLNLGLGDAALLAQTLQNTLTSTTQNDKLLRALRGYARERQAAASGVAHITDGLHLLFANPRTAVQRLRNWGMGFLNQSATLKNQVTMWASRS